jgi:acyl-CoA synthetase (AMP-forming)/AMP-acid ligase II
MNIAMLLELPAGTAPDQPILADDERDLTYAEVRDDVGRLAALLLAHGVRPADRVAVFATNSVRVVEVLFAAAAIGAVAVPMNYRARDEEVAHLLRDSAAKVVFADARYLAQLAAADVGEIAFVAFGAELDACLAGREPVGDFASVGDDAIVMYTSGTTALPKGVRLGHDGLTGFVLEAGEVADGEDHGTTLVAVPIYHIAGLMTVLVSLFVGRRVVVQREFVAAGWLAAVAEHRATEAFLVPTMLKRVLDEGVEGRDLSSLKLVRYGAAPMPETVIARAIAAFGASVGFMGAYGLTETTSTVAVLGVADHVLTGPGAEERRRRLTSVGRVVDDVEVEIRDEDDAPLAAGLVGRVCLRTARAMKGYSGRAEGGEWVETGDLGRLDDEGYLFLVGRAGDMIIRGGENIAPQEVERVLLEHPHVAEAAVVGVPDEEWGQRVVAAVVLDKPGAVDGDGLVEHTRSRLAGFKRPERVVVLDALPHTSTGKLMRRRVLEQLVADGDPQPHQSVINEGASHA